MTADRSLLPAAPASHAESTLSVDLPVRGHAITVVGSTMRALTTIATLVDAGASVTVVAAQPTAYVSDLAARGLITLRRRDFMPTDIDTAALVFAFTGRPDHDAFVTREAARQETLCVSGDSSAPATNGQHRHGRVIIVGGGPGDPGLLTVAGQSAITNADVIVTDRLAPVAAIGRLAPHAKVIDVSKVPGGRRTEQRDINALLVTHALAGRTVVRLKGGDGFVFGRGGEEVDCCVQAGVSVEVIPGVSSAIAVPAAALIPVTHRGLTQGFTVVSGHVPPGHPESTVDYAALAKVNTTIILMMAVANLGAIAGALIDAGMDVETPAAVIADGSLSSQTEARGTLGTIAKVAVDAAIGPPAITVIGAVAAFAPTLSNLRHAQTLQI